nr:MAG TPA: hypothetical protein [Caudoviricetes sp.]
MPLSFKLSPLYKLLMVSCTIISQYIYVPG